jgi:hypothetical protein
VGDITLSRNRIADLVRDPDPRAASPKDNQTKIAEFLLADVQTG